MNRRRLALLIGVPLLLAGTFYVTFAHPEVFAPGARSTSAAVDGSGGSGSHAGHDPAVGDAEATHADLRSVTPEELKAMLDRGDKVIVGDVRGKASFEKKHITGSRSMPSSEIQAWGPKLLPEELVVFYCS